MTNYDAVLTAASAALVPALRRGERGRRVDRASLGLDAAPLDRELQAAARERGLALFACTDSQRMVNVVSLAPPGERDWRRALEMLKTRPRSSSCSYCSLQSIVPANGKSPLVPVAGTFHRLHPDCTPGWKLWAEAAEKHLAARRPSPIPATAGLAMAVIHAAPQVLRGERGVRLTPDQLWQAARDNVCVVDVGAWASDGFGSSSFVHQLSLDPEVSQELVRAGLVAWLGADGLVRIARIATDLDGRVGGNRCGFCGICEPADDGSLVRLAVGAHVHAACWSRSPLHYLRRAA